MNNVLSKLNFQNLFTKKNFKRVVLGALVLTTVVALLPDEAQAQRRRRRPRRRQFRMSGNSNINRFPLFEFDTGEIDTDSSSSSGFFPNAVQNFVIFDLDFVDAGLNAQVTPDTSIFEVVDLAAEAGITPAISLLDLDDPEFGDLTVGTCCFGSFVDTDGNRRDFSRDLDGIDDLLSPSEVTDVIQYQITFPTVSDLVINFFAPNAITSSQTVSGEVIELTSGELVNSIEGLEQFFTTNVTEDIIIGFIDSSLTPIDGSFGDDFGVEASMAFEAQDVTDTIDIPEPGTTATLLALGTLGAGSLLRRKQKEN